MDFKNLTNQFKSKLKDLSEKTSRLKSPKNNSSEGEDGDRKKKPSIIVIVAVLGIAFLGVDWFMNQSDSDDPFANLPDPPKKKRKERKKKAATEEQKVVKEDVAQKEAQVPEVDRTVETPEVAQAVAEEDIVAETMGEKSDLGQISEDTSSQDNPISPAINVDLLAEDTSKEEEAIPQGPLGKKELFDFIKIKEDEDPPIMQYDIIGRGLVYNCKENHWACVNRSNYFNCIKKMKFDLRDNNPSTCVAKDVYASDEDCGNAQYERMYKKFIPKECGRKLD